MEGKKEHCKQLIKKWKDLISKISKVEPGSKTLEIRSNWKEREAVIRKLREECWWSESLSDNDRSKIQKEYCQCLYKDYRKSNGDVEWRAQDTGFGKRSTPYITPLLTERNKIKEELKRECKPFLSPEQLSEIENE